MDQPAKIAIPKDTLLVWPENNEVLSCVRTGLSSIHSPESRKKNLHMRWQLKEVNSHVDIHLLLAIDV